MHFDKDSALHCNRFLHAGQLLCRLPQGRQLCSLPLTRALCILAASEQDASLSIGEALVSLLACYLPTLVMDLCHSSAFDVNLDQNGVDTVELVESLWKGSVIYMGHSNGAVSSIVSASLDADAVAVLGLDPVERVGGDHTDDADLLDIPVRGLFGESGLCNTWNSGQSAYEAASDADNFRVTEADHCDFEAPTDTVCTAMCGGSNVSFDDDDILSTIMGMSTGFMMWQALGESEGETWWTSTGTAFTVLEDAGAISDL